MQETKITWTLIKDLWDDAIIAKWLCFVGAFVTIPFFYYIGPLFCCIFLMGFSNWKKRYIVALFFGTAYIAVTYFPHGI